MVLSPARLETERVPAQVDTFFGLFMRWFCEGLTFQVGFGWDDELLSEVAERILSI